jgi:hypothetical protein
MMTTMMMMTKMRVMGMVGHEGDGNGDGADEGDDDDSEEKETRTPAPSKSVKSVKPLVPDLPPGFPAFPACVLKPLFPPQPSKDDESEKQKKLLNEQKFLQLMEKLGPQKLVNEYDGKRGGFTPWLVSFVFALEMAREEDPSSWHRQAQNYLKGKAHTQLTTIVNDFWSDTGQRHKFTILDVMLKMYKTYDSGRDVKLHEEFVTISRKPNENINTYSRRFKTLQQSVKRTGQNFDERFSLNLFLRGLDSDLRKQIRAQPALKTLSDVVDYINVSIETNEQQQQQQQQQGNERAWWKRKGKRWSWRGKRWCSWWW